jgi:hypothetical protein
MIAEAKHHASWLPFVLGSVKQQTAANGFIPSRSCNNNYSSQQKEMDSA